MQHNILSDSEKKKIIQDILGENHNAIGQNFPVFSALIDSLSNANDILSLAELIPSLNTLLSGAVTSTLISAASFAGILLFPVTQMVNLVNAKQIGHRMYSYRCIAYTTTAWAFDMTIPTGSAKILSNISSGPIQKSSSATMEYNNLWRKTSTSVLHKFSKISEQNNVPTSHLKAIFRALGGLQTDKLCLTLLTQFEKQFHSNTRNIWKNNYKIVFPQ
ncbi:MAG: hypothetical protein COB30_015440 [Ectothiorhodospiraceae bacterium]|nr:hypothetical protein [Ectothiorhodospiraceae bacterium]